MIATRTPWWERVPPATVERFVTLVEQQRRLGRRPRPLLVLSERQELRDVEEQLDRLLAELRPAVAAAAAELVKGGAP